MRSYLWPSVFFLISLHLNPSDEKPILSNLIRKAGRGLQKIVSSFSSSMSVSSTSVSKNTPKSDENPKNTKNESDSELEKLSDEKVMIELEKMVNSDSKGSTAARQALSAPDMTEKKVNSSQKQLKCFGGSGFIALFFMLLQKLFTPRRQAVGNSVMSDTGTGMTIGSLFSLSPLARLLGIRPSQRRGPTTQSTTRIESEQAPIDRTTRIVEDFTDEFGVPRRRIINTQPTDTVLIERVPTAGNIARIAIPPTSSRTSIRRSQSPPLRSPVTITEEIVPTDRTTIRDVVSIPSRPPVSTREVITNFQPPTRISQPSTPPRTITTVTDSRALPPNSPVSTSSQSTRFLLPPSQITTERSNRPATPPTPTLPGVISNILSELGNQPPPERRPTETVQSEVTRFVPSPVPNVPRPIEPLRTQIEQIPEVTTSTQAQPVVSSRPTPDTLQLVPGGVFLRNNETPRQVVFDPVTNSFKPFP